MTACHICAASIEVFLSFGRMPIANGFLTSEEFSDEYFFDLEVAYCERCCMMQLATLVDQKRLFHDHYPFVSSSSAAMALHFEEFARWIRHTYVQGEDPFIVEIGSNDGIMLRHFASAGVRHLGVEPSANVAQLALERGVRTVGGFFDEQMADAILAEDGQVDACLGANVICHMPRLNSVFAGVQKLLKPRGIFAFEDPYVGDIIEKTAYDQIYDEHVLYLSVISVGRLASAHGLDLIDALPQHVHGGSMRYVLSHAGAYPQADAVRTLRTRELESGLTKPETYHKLRRNIERSRDQLRTLLIDLKSQGRRVTGYAATSKSTTVTNYCGLTADLVEFISDTTPMKQGKYSPGTHIPVRAPGEFSAKYPDYGLLFGWNHADEILAKEQAFSAGGGKWIVYVPRVRILN